MSQMMKKKSPYVKNLLGREGLQLIKTFMNTKV